MHLGIRAQLLFPLVPLVLGLIATTGWTAYSAAAAARQNILRDLDHIAATVRMATFPRNVQTLRLMKGLSGAEFLLCDDRGEPLVDDQGRPLTTLTLLPTHFPATDDGEPTTIRVDGVEYLSRGVRLTHDRIYFFFPTSVLNDAVARAVRPALIIGSVGGAASVLLALWFTQRLTKRIQDLQRRTRLIAAGDFSPMPLSPRRDELGDLGQSINEMTQQLSRFQETEKATERLRLLGQVSGGLAHQLRNGIAGAKLALQLHLKGQGGELPEPLQVALRQLALMENYLKRFFDLGKALEIRRERVDLAALVDDSASLLRPQCVHANIAFNVVAADRPLIAFVDPGQVRQALFNLITNAIEAAGPNGRVDVRTRREDSGDVIDVVDSGPGVPPSVQSKLFEPFVTNKPEGVGLGLAVSRQIAEAHGGTLKCLRLPEGTVFRLLLPGEKLT